MQQLKNETMDGIDIVYVLGNGSPWNNNEIRFSLRSIEKNVKGFRNIYVIGHHETWFRNIIHIPAEDPLENNADGNIILKVLKACEQKDLSDNFLFINDDHIIIKPVEASDIPPYQKGNMAEFNDQYWNLNFWRGRLKRTYEILSSKGYPTMHFDCHTPIIFNKNAFQKVINQFRFSDDIGYTMKSLYGNVMYPDAPGLNGEKKTIFDHLTVKQIRDRLNNAMILSFNDSGLNGGLKEYLIETFPDRSKYEDNQIQDPFLELMQWFENGQDYWKGVMIYEKYGKSTNVKKIFLMGENKRTREKLDWKMKQLINDI